MNSIATASTISLYKNGITHFQNGKECTTLPTFHNGVITHHEFDKIDVNSTLPLSQNGHVNGNKLEENVKAFPAQNDQNGHVDHEEMINNGKCTSNKLSTYDNEKVLNGHDDVSEEQHLIYTDYIITSSIFPMVLNVALELNLLGIIASVGAGGQLSPAEIAKHLPKESKNTEVTVSMLDRLLRLLASYSLLSCSLVHADGRSERRYGLAPAGRYLVPDEDGVSLAPLLSMAGHRAFRLSRGKLKDAVLEGENPFNMAHGMSAFEYAALDPSFNNTFNTAMRNYSSVIMKNVLNKYNGFKGITQLVEVAGGSGHLIKAIVSKYPSIKGINFDLPHVINNAKPHPDVEHVGGDMFESVPRGDAILMKWIIHDWDDEMCIKLLENCYASLPENGRVLILEGMLSEIPETTIAAKAVSLIDIAMLTQMKDGKERTREEFIMLSNAAGFRDIKFTCCICNYWIIELYK